MPSSDIGSLLEIFPNAAADEMLEACTNVLQTMLLEHPVTVLAPLVTVITIDARGRFDKKVDYIRDMDERRRELRALGAKLVRQGKLPVAAWLIGEAWMVAADTFEPDPDMPPPSEHPDRIEVIDIMGLLVDTRNNSVVFKTERDPQGNLIVGAQLGKQTTEFPAHKEQVSHHVLSHLFAGAADVAHDSYKARRSKLL